MISAFVPSGCRCNRSFTAAVAAARLGGEILQEPHIPVLVEQLAQIARRDVAALDVELLDRHLEGLRPRDLHRRVRGRNHDI
jgi:hypothetical protein